MTVQLNEELFSKTAKLINRKYGLEIYSYEDLTSLSQLEPEIYEELIKDSTLSFANSLEGKSFVELGTKDIRAIQGAGTNLPDYAKATLFLAGIGVGNKASSMWSSVENKK